MLGLVISEALLAEDREASEGQLAPRFNALVRKETCAAVAREIDLGAVLKLGRSEMKSGGRRKEALLGDAMEAVIAAIYRDAGFEAARNVVLRLWGDRIETVAVDARDHRLPAARDRQEHARHPLGGALVGLAMSQAADTTASLRQSVCEMASQIL